MQSGRSPRPPVLHWFLCCARRSCTIHPSSSDNRAAPSKSSTSQPIRKPPTKRSQAKIRIPNSPFIGNLILVGFLARFPMVPCVPRNMCGCSHCDLAVYLGSKAGFFRRPQTMTGGTALPHSGRARYLPGNARCYDGAGFVPVRLRCFSPPGQEPLAVLCGVLRRLPDHSL